MPKCKCVWIDRGKAIIKEGTFDGIIGSYKLGLIRKTEIPFYIPEKYRNITLESHGVMRSSVMPLFIIDAKTSMVLNYIQNPKDSQDIEVYTLVDGKITQIFDKEGKPLKVSFGIDMRAEFDAKIRMKLRVLIKASFWETLSKRIKDDKWMILIYAVAGYGGLRFIEYLVTILFGKVGD